MALRHGCVCVHVHVHVHRRVRVRIRVCARNHVLLCLGADGLLVFDLCGRFDLYLKCAQVVGWRLFGMTDPSPGCQDKVRLLSTPPNSDFELLLRVLYPQRAGGLCCWESSYLSEPDPESL